MKKKSKVVQYNKWGYIFLIPFIVVYCVFQLIPLITTVYNSTYENFMDGLFQVGPRYVGMANFKEILSTNQLWQYFGNTMIMWILGFLPQIIISLLLGFWFANPTLRLKCQGFFKTVIYMPNLIMAAAFSMLFFVLFSDIGPVNSLLIDLGILDEPFSFLNSVWGTRGLVAFMNFVMWFGNTTILLMAGMLGIDTSLYEAAQVDGATSGQTFFKVTLPLLRPILVYVMITSLIGGLQMFDVPSVLTKGTGNPARTSMTLIMWLNNHLFSKNYGMGGALSVLLFIITGILSVIVYRFSNGKQD